MNFHEVGGGLRSVTLNLSQDWLPLDRRFEAAMPVLISNDFPPLRGGIQRYMAKVAELLSSTGKTVVVVTGAVHGDRAYDKLQGFQVVRFGGGARLWSFFAMVIASLRAMAHVPRTYTLASIWFPSGLVAAIIPRRIRGPLGVFVHGAEVAPRRRGLRRLLMLFVFARADVLFADSRFTASLVRRAGFSGGNMVVVPCGSEAREVIRNPSPMPTVLSVGRLVTRKGFDRLIEALPLVRLALPTVQCEIVGSGPEEARLRTLVQSLCLGSCVHFLGEIDDVALDAAYARAWCFAMPVRTVGEDVEGFGIVYLEAAIAGLPAIGGRDSGATDAIVDDETGIIVDGNDPAAIADAVSLLLGSPQHANEMGARARKRALTEYTWHRTVTTIDASMNRFVKHLIRTAP